jgi:hypothetical protein
MFVTTSKNVQVSTSLPKEIVMRLLVNRLKEVLQVGAALL